MRFTADMQHCTIEKLDLVTMHSNVAARGVVTDYANPMFEGQYNATVVGDDLRRLLRNAALPSGEIALQGKVGYRTAAGPTWADRTIVEGRLDSEGLLLSTRAAGNGGGSTAWPRAAIRAVHGTYGLEHGQLRIDDLRAEALGGELASVADVIDMVRNSGRIRVSVKGASIQQATRLAAVQSSQVSQISALADLDVEASWRDSPSKAIAKVQGTFRRDPSAPPNAIPNRRKCRAGV